MQSSLVLPHKAIYTAATSILALLVVLQSSEICGEPAATGLYNQANELYRDGRYAEAAAKYEEVIAKGLKNGDAYYNLGNAYFKSGRIGKAILSYERALRLMPRDEDVRANLKFANTVKVDKDPPEDENAVTGFVRGVHNFLSPNELAILLSALFFAVWALSILMIFAGPTLRSGLAVSLVILGILLLLGGVSLTAKIHAREFVEMAIVMASEADGMSGPGEDYTKIFTLHEGTKVMIEREGEGWLLVRLTNGLGGWIKAGVIERI